MTSKWLRGDADVHVAYDDRTSFGSPTSNRAEWSVRDLFAPIITYSDSHGFAALAAAAPELLAEVIRSPDFRAVADLNADGTWRLHEHVSYPGSELSRPRQLTVSRKDLRGGNGIVRLGLPDSHWPLVHEMLAALCNEGLSDTGADDLHPDLRRMLAGLDEQHLLAAEPPGQPSPELDDTDFTFCGHNTVLMRGNEARVLVDPWLPARSTEYPQDYQPLQSADLGRIDAILITHSHPDHFDPASLLRLPTSIPVVLPVLKRETILATDIALRVRELGFTTVVPLGWGSSWTVGDVTVRSLPFFGEQPTDADQLHPEIRNVGNTYLVETPRCSAVFLADSGRDNRGDVRDVALRARADFGSVDVVFAGYRGWLTYPVQLLCSSVAHYLLFVPPTLWGCRMQLMIDADGALDVAERWGATALVPYADGGAPWHWGIGLGPRLDGKRQEVVGFDPFPERVAEAARCRTTLPGGLTTEAGVRVCLLRPGDSLTGVRRRPRRIRLPGHTWPWPEDLRSSST